MSRPETLNDACEFIVDCLHATAPTQEFGYPLIRTPNIGKGRLLLDGVFRVSDDTYRIWTQRATPQPNDLILAREAPAGNVAIVKEGEAVCLGQRTVHLRPDKSKVDADFLCYTLLTPLYQGRLLAGETGATAKHVNMKDIRRLKLDAFPALEEQRRAAQVIVAYDDLIENNRRRIKLLEEAARLLYREWFVHLRFPGHEHVKIVDGVPAGWSKRRLIDIAELTMGQSPASQHYNKDGIGFAFHQGVTNFGDRFVTHNNWCTVRGRMARAGDILFSVRAPVGRINVTKDEIVLGRGLAAIRSRSGQQSMLLYQLTSHFFKEDMIGGGAIYASVTKKELENQQLLCPESPLASEFESIASKIDSQISNLVEQNTKLQQARDLLLPRLMSGELAV